MPRKQALEANAEQVNSIVTSLVTSELQPFSCGGMPSLPFLDFRTALSGFPLFLRPPKAHLIQDHHEIQSRMAGDPSESLVWTTACIPDVAQTGSTNLGQDGIASPRKRSHEDSPRRRYRLLGGVPMTFLGEPAVHVSVWMAIGMSINSFR